LRVLLVDDHAVVRAGLRSILLAELPAATIAEAASAAEALDRVRTQRWDLVILDVSLPGRGGLDVLKELRVLRPGLRVLIMTVHSEQEYAVRALRAGAAGFLTKSAAPAELIAAVQRVRAGGRYVSAVIAEKLAERVATGDDPAAPPHAQLSDRELQILRLLGAGKSVKAIGKELGLSEKTVSTYRARVLEKLGLETTAELIRYALRSGLVE
jgi:DNA-binding NarL/FixJ family response regulator